MRTSQPGARPSQPGLRLSQPGLRPSQPGLRPNQPGLAGWPGGLAGWVSALAGWASGLAGWGSSLAGWASGLAGWASGLAGWASHLTGNLEVPESDAVGRNQVLNGLISPKLPPKKLFKVALYLRNIRMDRGMVPQNLLRTHEGNCLFEEIKIRVVLVSINQMP